MDAEEYLAITPHRQHSFTSLRSVLMGAAAGQPAKHRCLVQVRLQGKGGCALKPLVNSRSWQ